MAIRDKLHKGWMRAWIVASVIITLVSFIAIYPTQENQRTWQMTAYSRADIKTEDDERAVIESFFAQPERFLFDEMKACDPREAYLVPLDWKKVDSSLTVSCPRSAFGKLEEPVGTAASLSALLFLIGLVVAWIRSGFKQQKLRE